MKDVLLRTRKDSNILHLRARDYYFVKAKQYHQMKMFFASLPAVLTILLYAVLAICSMQHLAATMSAQVIKAAINDYADIALGACTVACFFIVKLLESKSDHYKEKSNIQREMYDNVVFQLKHNLFSYDYGSAVQDKEAGRKCPENYNNWKYEYWYDETFSDDLNRNVLCMQMDNALYTYHVFSLCKKDYIRQFIGLLGLLVVLMVCASALMGWSMCILVLFAMFELIRGKWEEIKTAEEMIARNKALIDTVSEVDNVAVILSDLPYHIYCIEQCMIENRKNGLFLPKKVRNLYIDYYGELDDIKNYYLDDETTSFPQSSSEIEIFTADESKTHTLRQLQDRLNSILQDIASLLESNQIPYYLDKSSLLGAVRGAQGDSTATGGFLFWEDMIHITIPRAFEVQAKKLIETAYPQKYTVQDMASETFMSSAPYTFRVREQNCHSLIHTKELLSPLFAEKGIYITVSTIGPIVVNQSIDKLIRKVLFHGLRRKIKTENSAVYRRLLLEDEKKLGKAKQKYTRYATRYQSRLQTYCRLAKNERVLCHTPGNVQKYEKYEIEKILRKRLCKEKTKTEVPAQPEQTKVTRRPWSILRCKKPVYLPTELILESQKKVLFEGRTYPAPKDCDAYLEKLYGSDWHISHVSTKEALKQKHGKNWYSKANRFHVSSLRHTRHVDL